MSLLEGFCIGSRVLLHGDDDGIAAVVIVELLMQQRLAIHRFVVYVSFFFCWCEVVGVDHEAKGVVVVKKRERDKKWSQ